MAINTNPQCSCAFLAINTFEYVGPSCQGITGLLKSGHNYRVGDFVKWDGTDGYEPVDIADTLTASDRVGIIKSIYEFPGNTTYNQVNADGSALSSDFKNAILWMSGSETRFKCSDVYLKNSSTRVAFDPDTHTSLADQLKIISDGKVDGSDVVNYFTFR